MNLLTDGNTFHIPEGDKLHNDEKESLQLRDRIEGQREKEGRRDSVH